eukprot:6194422-Pleurochrysis_carterae.AAC.1
MPSPPHLPPTSPPPRPRPSPACKQAAAVPAYVEKARGCCSPCPPGATAPFAESLHVRPRRS